MALVALRSTRIEGGLPPKSIAFQESVTLWKMGIENKLGGHRVSLLSSNATNRVETVRFQRRSGGGPVERVSPLVGGCHRTL